MCQWYNHNTACKQGSRFGHRRQSSTEAQIELNSHNTLFKLDTGAAVTVLSDNVEWLQSISLPGASHTLCGPGNIRLPVKGQFHLTLKYGQPSSNEPVYVLHNQTCSLLSRKACVELRLIKHTEKDVEEVNSGRTDFKAVSITLHWPWLAKNRMPHNTSHWC